MIEAWDGLLPLDKPAGPTSHDVVARVRAATGVRRVGHTGTLDPPATGLLLLMLGRATRLARFIPDAPKTYHGVFALGVTTTSDDLSGNVVRRHDGPLPPPETVQAAAAARLGRQLQVPPAVSARHVGGVRLYRLARRGEVTEAPASEVVVDRFDVTPTDAEDRWSYEIVVSTGAYVRAAVRDLGAALGCGAAVASLRRQSIGPFTVDTAVSVPGDRDRLLQVARDGLIAIDAMPLRLPSLALHSPADLLAFAAGRAVADPAGIRAEPALTAVRDDRGKLLGVGLLAEGFLRPRVVLSAPE